MKKMLLITTKNAGSKDYLSTYGNKYWKTSNINELEKNRAVFNRHYTVAATTAMAFFL